jgi:hypothetical protein
MRPQGTFLKKVILIRVHPEMVDFASGQGPSVFCNRRHSATIPRIAEKREHSPGPKDAVSGWTPIRFFGKLLE